MFFRLLANHSPLRQCDPLPNHASVDQGGARASRPEQGYGHRASLAIYHAFENLGGGLPHVTASHRHSSGRAAVPLTRKTGQQRVMLKLFGAAATFGVVLR